MVREPRSNIMEVLSWGAAFKFCDRADPAGAAHELALAYTLEGPLVRQKMQQRLRGVGREQATDHLVQNQFASLRWPIRENRRMKMPVCSSVLRKEANERRNLRRWLAHRESHNESKIPFVGSLRGERKPLA